MSIETCCYNRAMGEFFMVTGRLLRFRAMRVAWGPQHVLWFSLS